MTGRGISTDSVVVSLSWIEDAACKGKDPNIFFPEHTTNTKTATGPGAYNLARVICSGCPVQQDCLNYALATFLHHDDDHGMWGGMSPTERRKYRRAKRKLNMGLTVAV